MQINATIKCHFISNMLLDGIYIQYAIYIQYVIRKKLKYQARGVTSTIMYCNGNVTWYNHFGK